MESHEASKLLGSGSSSPLCNLISFRIFRIFRVYEILLPTIFCYFSYPTDVDLQCRSYPSDLQPLFEKMINVRSWRRMHCICTSMTSQELGDDRLATPRTLAPSLTPILGKSGWIFRPSARFLNQASTSLPYRTVIEPGYSSTKVLSLMRPKLNKKFKIEKFK